MSSYYGVVFPEFWTGPTGRAIRAEGKDAQLLALYLMSCQSATMLGLYRIPLDTIRFETGIGDKGIRKAFDALSRLGFADYDVRTEFTWVHEMAKFRLGLMKAPLKPKDKRAKGVRNLYEKLAVNPFLAPFFDRYAKQLRIKIRRESELPIQPLYELSLGRGFEGACKPETGTGTETEVQDQNKPAPKARRDSPAVENPNDDPFRAPADRIASALRDREVDPRSRSGDRGVGVEGGDPGQGDAAGVRHGAAGAAVAGDGAGRRCEEAGEGTAAGRHASTAGASSASAARPAVAREAADGVGDRSPPARGTGWTSLAGLVEGVRR